MQSEQNALGQTPGIKCPECGFHIQVTIAMLLNNLAVFCSNCGLKLTVDQQESNKSLDQLRKLNTEVKKAERAKESPYD
jgi:DNA-directed RNA polymerase subunit RPC12/RpoP